MSENSHSVWLHVHVPKAGGSTIRQLLNRTFGKGYYNSNSLLETKQYTRADVSEIIRCHGWLRGFSDHKLSLDLPYDSTHADVYALCFVRNPVERFVSRFRFHRNFEEVNCIAQKMSFREFAEMELVQGYAHPQTNSQIQFLNGLTGPENLDVIRSALASGKVLLYPIERFDDACVVLENRFPEIFTELSYVRVNVSEGLDPAIPTDDRTFVRDQLESDFALIDLAESELSRAIANSFPTNQAFQQSKLEFLDRCSRRVHNFRPLLGADEPRPRPTEITHDRSTNKPEHPPRKNHDR